MSNPNDLLDPLRFKSLGEYQLNDIRAIGGGVFTQEDTLLHLELLDKIAKAYRSVHAPTYGDIIPGTASIKETSGTISSDGTTVILTPQAGEVFLVQSIAFTASEDNNTVQLQIKVDGGGIHPLTQVTALTTGKIMPFVGVNFTDGVGNRGSIGEPFKIAYPQSLSILAKDEGGSGMSTEYSMLAIKTQQ